MNLKSLKFANGKLVTAFGVLEFGENGELVSPKLSEEAVKALSDLKGFEVIETASKEEKAEEPKKAEETTEKATENVKKTEEKPRKERKSRAKTEEK